jgi:hypothetical protein
VNVATARAEIDDIISSVLNLLSANNLRIKFVTYFVGAVASSMGPFMKDAIFCAAAFVSSCDFDTLSFAISSSRTLMDFAFSEATLPLEDFVVSMASTEGILKENERKIDKIGGGYRIKTFRRALNAICLSLSPQISRSVLS